MLTGIVLIFSVMYKRCKMLQNTRNMNWHEVFSLREGSRWSTSVRSVAASAIEIVLEALLLVARARDYDKASRLAGKKSYAINRRLRFPGLFGVIHILEFR